MRYRVCYEFADLHPVPLIYVGKCHILFCSHKAVQIQIYKIAVRYDRQKFPLFISKSKSESKWSSGTILVTDWIR